MRRPSRCKNQVAEYSARAMNRCRDAAASWWWTRGVPVRRQEPAATECRDRLATPSTRRGPKANRPAIASRLRDGDVRKRVKNSAAPATGTT